MIKIADISNNFNALLNYTIPYLDVEDQSRIVYRFKNCTTIRYWFTRVIEWIIDFVGSKAKERAERVKKCVEETFGFIIEINQDGSTAKERFCFTYEEEQTLFHMNVAKETWSFGNGIRVINKKHPYLRMDRKLFKLSVEAKLRSDEKVMAMEPKDWLDCFANDANQAYMSMESDRDQFMNSIAYPR